MSSNTSWFKSLSVGWQIAIVSALILAIIMLIYGLYQLFASSKETTKHHKKKHKTKDTKDKKQEKDDFEDAIQPEDNNKDKPSVKERKEIHIFDRLDSDHDNNNTPTADSDQKSSKEMADIKNLLEQQKQDLEQQKVLQQQQLDEIQALKDQLAKQEQKKQTTEGTTQTDPNATEQERQHLDEERKKLEEEQKKLQEEKKKMEEEAQTNKDELKNKDKEINDKDKEINNLKQQLETLKNDPNANNNAGDVLTSLKNRAEKLLKDIDDLSKDPDRNCPCDYHGEQLENLYNNVDALLNDIPDEMPNQEEMANSNFKPDRVNRKLDDYEKEYKKLENAMVAHKNQLYNLKDKINNLKKQLRPMKEQDKYYCRRFHTDDGPKKLYKQAQKLENVAKRPNVNADDLESEVDELQEKVDDMFGKLMGEMSRFYQKPRKGIGRGDPRRDLKNKNKRRRDFKDDIGSSEDELDSSYDTEDENETEYDSGSDESSDEEKSPKNKKKKKGYKDKKKKNKKDNHKRDESSEGEDNESDNGEKTENGKNSRHNKKNYKYPHDKKGSRKNIDDDDNEDVGSDWKGSDGGDENDSSDNDKKKEKKKIKKKKLHNLDHDKKYKDDNSKDDGQSKNGEEEEEEYDTEEKENKEENSDELKKELNAKNKHKNKVPAYKPNKYDMMTPRLRKLKKKRRENEDEPSESSSEENNNVLPLIMPKVKDSPFDLKQLIEAFETAFKGNKQPPQTQLDEFIEKMKGQIRNEIKNKPGLEKAILKAFKDQRFKGSTSPYGEEVNIPEEDDDLGGWLKYLYYRFAAGRNPDMSLSLKPIELDDNQPLTDLNGLNYDCARGLYGIIRYHNSNHNCAKNKNIYPQKILHGFEMFKNSIINSDKCHHMIIGHPGQDSRPTSIGDLMNSNSIVVNNVFNTISRILNNAIKSVDNKNKKDRAEVENINISEIMDKALYDVITCCKDKLSKKKQSCVGKQNEFSQDDMFKNTWILFVNQKDDNRKTNSKHQVKRNRKINSQSVKDFGMPIYLNFAAQIKELLKACKTHLDNKLQNLVTNLGYQYAQKIKDNIGEQMNDIDNLATKVKRNVHNAIFPPNLENNVESVYSNFQKKNINNNIQQSYGAFYNYNSDIYK